MSEEQGFGWNEDIDANAGNDNSSFEVLPAGKYPFKIHKFEKGKSKSNGNNMAIITLLITFGKKRNMITDYLVLQKNMEWKISGLFKSVESRGDADKIPAEWDRLKGATGIVSIKRQISAHWTEKNGTETWENTVVNYEPPIDEDYEDQVEEEEPQTPGKF